MIMKSSEHAASHIDATFFRGLLKSQYHATFAMLREVIENCPDDLWLSVEPRNAYWQVAYHTLFFGHLYMLPNEDAFEPWRGHQGDVQHPDGIPGRVDPNSSLPIIPSP